MRLVKTVDAVGHVLCHDMTQIVVGGEGGQGRYKGPRFRKGHVVTEEDVPVLLSMGKEHLYVWELAAGMLHENDAAERMAALCLGPNTVRAGAPREGKISIRAACDGVLLVNAKRLRAVNATDEVMVATRKGNLAVRAGDELAGTRVIPLVIREEQVAAAERAAHGERLLAVEPFKLRTAAIIATGSEVKSGLIEDKFTPVVQAKLAAFNIRCTSVTRPGDDPDDLAAAIGAARREGVDLICCTGGMSVDPDDNTPGAIRRAGARIVSYGAPVLPGAMMLLGYFGKEGVCGPGTPVVGLPGCVMYAASTVFDLVLPRIAAGVELTKQDFAELGEGGLAIRGRFSLAPNCPFEPKE
ncbi:molybdopterin-binding protein [Olsenella massiliensis]|uniref:molybdopterin-binding protein n=1 Tax=Olsenella massiliensis TaxID=1622075 RepID=UPI00071D9B9D|nr:molybdopterin-binding protein [Olsenella massiliensis]